MPTIDLRQLIESLFEHIAGRLDWRWSSAWWYESRRSVGVPIRWTVTDGRQNDERIQTRHLVPSSPRHPMRCLGHPRLWDRIYQIEGGELVRDVGGLPLLRLDLFNIL